MFLSTDTPTASALPHFEQCPELTPATSSTWDQLHLFRNSMSDVQWMAQV